MSDKIEKTIDELKTEALELGLQFHANISVDKLSDRIEAHYKASEEQSKVVLTGETGNQDSEEDLAAALKVENTSNFQQYVQKQKREAEKTVVVTIIDNDSRVNNVTTTVTVGSSNEYFDLGTVILPLNDRVEIRQGHLNVLKELRIPQHLKNPNDPSISVMVVRPRYTIQYEQPITE
jgi:hypothetical protein